MAGLGFDDVTTVGEVVAELKIVWGILVGGGGGWRNEDRGASFIAVTPN